MAKFTADQVSEKALALLKQHPEGLISSEIQSAIYGETKNEDIFRRNQQHLGFAMMTLRKSGKVLKDGRMGKFRLSNGAPSPDVHDLPASKRGRPRGSTNGVANPLRAYLIRDIKAKLAELESLD